MHPACNAQSGVVSCPDGMPPLAGRSAEMVMATNEEAKVQPDWGVIARGVM